MAIYLDFVGLNTLVYENVTSSMNLIGSENVVTKTALVGANQAAKAYSKCLRSAATTDSEAYLFGAPTSYPDTGGFSNSFWIKLDNNTTSLRTIWYDIPPARTIDNSLELENGKLIFKISNNADTDYRKWFWAVSANTLTSWMHIAITWGWRFYLCSKIIYKWVFGRYL
jgi:hypothetical protein